MGADDEGDEQVGCRCLDLGPYLLGGGSVSHDVQVLNLVPDTLHWEVFGRISPQGGPQDDGETTSARKGRRMGITPAGGRGGGGRTTGGGDLRLTPP